ncbi:MAG TPA: Dam family site-specific DNA-(adenine-N6)-methyltransferase [Polyangia bacterium]|nr:Dam family site-specific DNA-(adenine-N6)-methyltransferase [Polyangia bacterium]
MPAIMKVVPSAIDTYYEPFVGGGAVFFALAAAGRFRRAVLADANQELILCYVAVRDEVDQVIDALVRYRYDKDAFYAARAVDPESLTLPARAARLIYLNRAGYNGLYRVNKSGLFNVPFGRHQKLVICDEPRLRAASAALKDVDIRCQDFAVSVETATSRDFVYFDPPYVPLSRTSSFTAYAQGRFGNEEQRRLAATLRHLGNNGVPALLSNSDCLTTRTLYRHLPRTKIPVRRAINSVATARGPVGELLVRSYDF